MGDRYRIDGHKLIHHLLRVAAWQRGEIVYPIYAEVSPSGSCNHRCLFCALDYLEYRTRFLDAAVMAERFAEMAGLGLKSVLFGGEGEPLLNPGFARMAASGRAAGLDLALTTNGVLWRGELQEATLGLLQWVKVSFNAATRETYAAVHRARPEDFDAVVANLEAAVRLRETTGAPCTLGAQILLLPENRAEIAAAAGLCRDIGLDYLVVKPYSQHRFSRTERYREIRYAEYLADVEAAAACATDRCSVIARRDTMRAWDEGGRPYARCLALPFWTYVDAGGGVWGCSAWLGDERFHYGNVLEQGFREIWEGERRRASLAFVGSDLDVRECRLNCRMDKINRFLWEVRHPPEHVNFI
jgi:MoaA/NifB/PqqE/SkfB family radical SAM enzyme